MGSYTGHSRREDPDPRRGFGGLPELQQFGLRDRREFGAPDERVIRQQPGQFLARSRNPALDRADRAVADVGHFLIAEAAGADERQDFAVAVAELREGAPEVAEFKRRFLGRGG